MCNFLKEDVIKVAKAIYSQPLELMDDYTPYYFCGFCDSQFKGKTKDSKKFKHDLDCPVLVAQDLLTEV